MAEFDWVEEIKRRIENGADAIEEVNRWEREHGYTDTRMDSIPAADITSFYNEVTLVIAESRDDQVAVAEAELVIHLDSGGIIH